MLNIVCYRDADEQSKIMSEGNRVVTPVDLKRAEKRTPEWRKPRKLVKMRARNRSRDLDIWKTDHQLGRNFLRSWLGDGGRNVLLAAVGWNIRKLLRFLSEIFRVLWVCLPRISCQIQPRTRFLKTWRFSS